MLRRRRRPDGDWVGAAKAAWVLLVVFVTLITSVKGKRFTIQ